MPITLTRPVVFADWQGDRVYGAPALECFPVEAKICPKCKLNI